MEQKNLVEILRSLNKKELQVILWYVRLRWIRHKTLSGLRRVDLWLFPPAAFIACYKAISLIVPAQHPMAFITILGTSFMGATLTLLLIRPPKKRTAHWINQGRNHELH
jgi:hypothetical protein